MSTAQVQLYDASKPITLRGLIFGAASYEPDAPVYWLLQVVQSNGASEEWAIEGDSRAGNLVKPGQTITVLAFPPMLIADVLKTVPQPRRGSAGERVRDLAKAGRLVRGTEATMADGSKVTLGKVR